MRSNPTGRDNRLAGLALLIVLTGCSQQPTQSTDTLQNKETPPPSGIGLQDVDRVFDQANGEPRSGLDALDMERLGLGNYWNTLDENGDGQISRQEFRQRFQDPGIQRQLQMKTQLSEAGATDADQTVSSSWHLPPESASREWRRSGASAAPATLSTPSATAWGVAPADALPDSKALEDPNASSDPSDDSFKSSVSP